MTDLEHSRGGVRLTAPPAETPAETPAAPKRLSLSQIVEMLLTRPTGDRSSVSLTRSATTGETQIEVSVGTNDADVLTVEDAESKAVEVYERLRASYPPMSGHDNSAVTLTRNAKGETQIEVGTKTGNTGYASLAEAATAVSEAYDATRMKYPMLNGLTAKPGSVA